MNKFGLSDSVLDAARAVLNKQEAEDIPEAMEMHLKPHGTDGTKYKVHAVGKKLAAHGGIKVGEVLNDTEVDDARESGVRVKHVKEDVEDVEESIGGAIGKGIGGVVKTAGKAVGGTAKVAGKVAGGAMKTTGKVAGAAAKTTGKVAGSVAGGTAAATKGAAKGVAGGAVAAGKGITSGVKDTAKGGASGTVSTAKGTAQGGKELVKRTAAGIKEEDEVEEGAMKRMATQKELGEPGSGLETFKKKVAFQTPGQKAKHNMKSEALDMKIKPCPPKDALGGPKMDPSIGVATVSEEDEGWFDALIEMDEAEFDQFLDESTDEQLDEILSAISRGVGKAAMGAGRLIKKGAGAAMNRMSVQGRADAAEKKTQKIQDKTKAVQDKMAARKKLDQQKAAASLAKQKLKAIKQQAKKQRSSMGKPAYASEEVEIEEQMLGTKDSERLNGGKSKDPRFKSPGSHIDYHHRQTGGHMKSGGDVDKHRFQVAKKLGYMEEVEIEESVGLSTEVMSFLDDYEDIMEKKHMDPVGDEDEDIDNDGDVDDSDSYLHNRRKAIKKAMKKKIKEADEKSPESKAGVTKGYFDRMKLVNKGLAYARPKRSGPPTGGAQAFKDKMFGKKKVEEANDEEKAPFEGGKPIPKKRMDKFGNVIKDKNAAKHLAKMAMQKQATKEDYDPLLEGAGDEQPSSAGNAAELAKHYRMKSAKAAEAGNAEVAAKMASVAKKFYNKADHMGKREEQGRGSKAAESFAPETFWSDEEIIFFETDNHELEEARKGGGAKVGETERSGLRVTKSSKEEPEHIAMQLRKAVSVGKGHEGVHFDNGGKQKVHPNVARAALSRYNSAKPAEKEEMQKHMKHSMKALAHVAGGHDLSKSPAAAKKDSGLSIKSDPTQLKRYGVSSKSGHYN